MPATLPAPSLLSTRNRQPSIYVSDDSDLAADNIVDNPRCLNSSRGRQWRPDFSNRGLCTCIERCVRAWCKWKARLARFIEQVESSLAKDDGGKPSDIDMQFRIDPT